MAFTRPTLKELVARIGADFDTWLEGTASKLSVTVTAVLARVHAAIAHGLYAAIAWVARQILPDTAEDENLVRHASLHDITPIGAKVAQGTVTVATSQLGAVIAVGATLRRADDLLYTVTAETTVTGATTILPVTCQTGGATGNADAGVVLSITQPIEGVATQATVVEMGGGADAESTESLRARLLDHLRQPPHGGAGYDYEAWVKSVIGDGKVWTKNWVDYPELAPGSVVVRFMMPDGSIPDTATVAAVTDRILASPDASKPGDCKPVTAKVQVLAPVAAPLTFEISGLNPISGAVKAAIEAELGDLIFREAAPGGTLLVSHVREAISTAAGEVDHVLVSPVANVTVLAGEITTFGGVTWS